MTGIIETCIEASCSAIAKVVGGVCGPGMVKAIIGSIIGKAWCGPVTWAKACATIMGK